MDYFFWDEIFGARQNLVDALLEEPGQPEDPERISVIIAYVESFQSPQNG
ncbi:MAG TPA: hypothetical protein V6D47_13705 [Oscillatoriaceae cyanobacterium]